MAGQIKSPHAAGGKECEKKKKKTVQSLLTLLEGMERRDWIRLSNAITQEYEIQANRASRRLKLNVSRDLADEIGVICSAEADRKDLHRLVVNRPDVDSSSC